MHRPKTAGVFVNSYFRVKVFEPQGWRIENSWKDLHRDWNEEELRERLTDPTPNHFITNHGKAWPIELIRLARENGFTTFAWARHPGDLLCSYYYFHMKEYSRQGRDYPKFKIPIKEYNQWPLDTWLRHMLDDPTCGCAYHKDGGKLSEDPEFSQDGWMDWQTPPWVDELDVYMPFTMQNFMWFLREKCNIGYHEWAKRNESNNAGWDGYVDQFVIRPETADLLYATEEWHKWEALTRQFPLA